MICIVRKTHERSNNKHQNGYIKHVILHNISDHILYYIPHEDIWSRPHISHRLHDHVLYHISRHLYLIEWSSSFISVKNTSTWSCFISNWMIILIKHWLDHTQAASTTYYIKIKLQSDVFNSFSLSLFFTSSLRN